MSHHTLSLIVTGSIAAVKTFDLVEQLRARDIDVRLILTSAAKQWITPEAAHAVSSHKAVDADDDVNVHDTLQASDATLIAPASADFIAQLHHKNSAIAIMLRNADKLIWLAPAMNVMMWEHPATQRNIKALRAENMGILGPVQGNMACGDTGYGRFMEPSTIAEAVAMQLQHKTENAAWQAIDNALKTEPTLPKLSQGAKTASLLLVVQNDYDATYIYGVISQLRSKGYDVRVALGEGAQAWLPSEGVATISNNPAYTHHYQYDAQGMEHIRLPEQADMVIIAPASAEGVKKMAEGNASGFEGCIYLATKKPVIVVPSMTNPPALADLEVLKRDGATIIDIPHPAHGQTSKQHAHLIANALDTYLQQTIEGRTPHERT